MKKIISITAIFMALMISCTKVEVADNNTNPLPMPEKAQVAVQGLGVTPKANYVVVGEPVQLEVSVSPEEAVAGTVSWTSSDPAVATVDAEGKVTTLAVGIARITAAMEGVSATAIVNVFAERVPATEIKLSKTEVNLLVGRAANVKSSLLPENTTDSRNLEWTSSDEKVAVVSYGYIQAVGMGECTVTAKQDDLTATVKVTVADKIKLVDRSDVWTITDTPKWDKNWQGNITGSHEEVTVAGFDGEYAYFGVVDAAKFEGVEAVSNAVYEQVVEKQDAGQSPQILFNTGETFTQSYSEMGEAVAYLLAYDAEFEFTGEYAVYNFEARTPDPVHATGIQFTQGWNNSPISKIELKEGKSLSYFSASLLPDDCTDTGNISFKSSDESIVVIKPYYSNYYTVTAVAAGEAEIVATFNDITASIPVTVTGSSITLKDRTADWKVSTRVEEEDWYGTIYKTSYATVTVCDAQGIYAFGDNEIPSSLKSYLTSKTDNVYSWNIKSGVPAEFSFYDEVKYVFVVGMDASGAWTGEYGIYAFGDQPGGDQPGGDDPVTAKMVAMSNNYFSVTWEDEYASLDELTMEGWVYGDSFTGNASGNAGLASMMGVEGIFLIRLQNGKPEVVCDKDSDEKKVASSTALADKEWHHIAATYSAGNKIILYVDGEEAGSTDAPNHKLSMNGVGDGWAGGGLTDWHFFIGVSCQTSRDFDGSLAYLRCWDTVRSAAQIKDNMKVADPDDPGYSMMANWYFNEGSGNTITDHSINGYDITANSDLSWIDGTLPF